jgi:GAF domain-containing protein
MSLKASLDELEQTLSEQGMPAAVALLNSHTHCRFTSVYRFDADVLRNITFFDRLNPETDPPDDIPIEASYCVYVRDTRRPFHVADALYDLRVESHPKRQVIHSYYGVPLENELGDTFGTLCHFDVQAVPISEENISLMEAFAKMLRKHMGRQSAR